VVQPVAPPASSCVPFWPTQVCQVVTIPCCAESCDVADVTKPSAGTRLSLLTSWMSKYETKSMKHEAFLRSKFGERYTDTYSPSFSKFVAVHYWAIYIVFVNASLSGVLDICLGRTMSRSHIDNAVPRNGHLRLCTSRNPNRRTIVPIGKPPPRRITDQQTFIETPSRLSHTSK
jgi:hypothetical protein